MTVPRGRTLNSALLKEEFILLNLLLKFDLYPSSSYSVITIRDLTLLYQITTCQCFDVADIIFRMLAGTTTNTREYLCQQYMRKVQLVYPFLITRICESLGVPVYAIDSLMVGRAPLTSDTMKKSIATRGKVPDTSTSSHAPAPAQPTLPTPSLPHSDAPTEWTP
ncbi:uncharacterized protein A4U43_C04F20710 [Asparagus officinalis]|uniref:Uncharacterized protein n=1 Tax=Asparagus officinalis TaxID=4686 RepID=A0A5P1F327_ASPOF|nr:uncharacterized protein A4U43_C04F20710 [Asparagus officinalis]